MRLGILGVALLGGLLAGCAGQGRLTGGVSSSDVLRVGGDAPVAEAPPAGPAAETAPAPVPPAPAPAEVMILEVQPAPPPPCAPVVCAPCPPCGPCGPKVRWCEPCAPPPPCSPGYIGVALAGGPGLGGGIFAGLPVGRDSLAVWFLEANLTYQDLSAFAVDENQSGKYMQALVGFKGLFMPDCNFHPTVRAMVGWMVATGDPAAVDIADIPAFDDYIGGYLSVGFEWDVSRRFSTGPELGVFGGWGVNDADFAVVPQLRWNFIFNF